MSVVPVKGYHSSETCPRQPPISTERHPLCAYEKSRKPIVIRTHLGCHEVIHLDRYSDVLPGPIWNLDRKIPRDVYLVLVYVYQLFMSGIFGLATGEREWIAETIFDSNGEPWKYKGEPARVWVQLGETGSIIFTYTSSSLPGDHIQITFS